MNQYIQKDYTSNEKLKKKDPYKKQSSENCLLAKRVFDIVVSFIVIVFILSWLIPILAILIIIDSRGPVFFTQKRVGANGKMFKCYKLRSMWTNDQANSKQAQANDPRITLFGNFLRKSCMDELPQFVNVLIGQMSIVGPRPHMISDCEKFSKVIPNYDLRHVLKPGITGMAQIKGFRGETNCFYDVSHRYKWDLFYVKNTSFILDLKIIHKTSLQTMSALIKSPESGSRNIINKTIPEEVSLTLIPSN